MKIARGVLAGLTVLAMVQAAQAAPKVSGKYALMIHVQCNARIATQSDTFDKGGGTSSGSAVTSVNSQENGELSIGVGTLTFPTTAASSGTANINLSFVGADVLRVNGGGSDVGTHAEAFNGTFLFTNTTFRFTPTGEPVMVWTMRFADVAPGGVARTLYLVRKEDASCLNAITATKQ